MGQMHLSTKNTNFIERYEIAPAELKDDGFGEVHGEAVGLIVQPADARRFVLVMDRKQAHVLTARLIVLLGEDFVAEMNGEDDYD